MHNKKDEEINKCILEWLITKKYTKAVEEFLKESSLKKEDAAKGNNLDKNWGAILTLQKKVSDLETQVKQLKEDLESGGKRSETKKDAEFIGLPKNNPKATIKGHKQSVTCLAFHPFYKRLASGSDDASIIIWELDDFTQERSIRAHSNTVNFLSFDVNGKYLASCSADLSIKVWNFETMTCFKTLTGHEHTVSAIEFTPDGNSIISASRDKTIRVWDVHAGNCKKVLDGHDDWVRSISVSSKGNYFASCADDDKIIIWTSDYNKVAAFNEHTSKVERVLFLKNEKSKLNVYMADYLNAESTENKTDIEKINEKLIEKTKIVKAKEEIDKKEYLLSGSRDKTIIMWDALEKKKRLKFATLRENRHTL